MEKELIDGLRTVSGVAAPVGVLLGVLLAGWRVTLAANLFPRLTKAQSERIILHLAYLAWSASIAAMATYAFVTTKDRTAPTVERPASSVQVDSEKGPFLPEGKSGWILAGRFQALGGAPTADVVVNSMRPLSSSVSDSVDTLAEFKDGAPVKLASPTRVRVVNFVNVGWAGADVSPTTKLRGIEPGDETGVRLPAGARMVIRGVASYRQGDLVVVWLRVADQPVRISIRAHGSSFHDQTDSRYVWVIAGVLLLLLVALAAFVIGRGLRDRPSR